MDRPLRRLDGVRLVAATQAARDYVESFFDRLNGPAGRFYFAWPEHVPSPDAAPTLTAVVSGDRTQRTVTCRFAWRNATGTTVASPTGTLVVPANSLVSVAVPVYPSGATQAVIYAAQDAAGAEQQQTILSLARTWTQPNAALLLATTSPPATNTATETPLCMLVGDSLRFPRGTGLSWEIQFSLEEVWS
ncbi:MAG: hypothetical protein V2A73_21335 [Pseudomonadota bacterium]